MTRILLVDDVKLFRHLEAALLGWRGYSIEEAASGAEAMEKIRENPPDLALIDLYMPGMSGLEVCEQIKKDPALSSIPVIMVTSSNRDEDIRKAIQAGCDDYMTKPLEDATLLRKVEDLLGTVTKRRFPRVPASMQISFEDFKGIFFEFTRDISRSGVFIEMADPLPTGSHIRLSFSLPSPFGHSVMAYGRVVRTVEKTDDRPGGMGVNFISMNEQSQRLIGSLVEAQGDFEHKTGVFSRLSVQEQLDGQRSAPAGPKISALCDERDELQEAFDELQHEQLRISAMMTLIESLHADHAPKMLLAVALDVLGDLLGAAACGIFLVGPGERLVPANSRGLPATIFDKMSVAGPIEKALTDRCLQIPDPPFEVASGATSVLAVAPIVYRELTIGVVTIHELYPQKPALASRDHQLLELLAQHLGLALANATARAQSGDKIGVAEILKVSGFGR